MLFAGNYSSDWTVDEGIWLWKFDSDGQLIWEQSLIRPGGDRIRVKTVVAENGGRIFLMGYSLTDEELVVMEIDEEGNLLDVQEYAYPSTMSFVFIGGDSESMIPLYDEYGQFEGLGIAATILASAPGGSSIMNMFHTRLSSDLSVEPGYPLLFGAPGQTSTTSEGLLQLPDGTVVLYGWGSGGLSALVRVDVDGSLIWDDYTTTGSDSTIIRDLERLPNGDLISFGAIRTPALAPVAPWREYVRVHDLSTGVVVNEMEYQSAAEGVASTRLPGGDYAFISKLTPASSGYNITTISSSTLSVIDQDFAPLAGSTVLPLGFDYYPTQVTVMQDGDLGILSYSTPVGFYLDPLAGQFVKLKSDITFP